MTWDPDYKPVLRSLEPLRLPSENGDAIQLRDPSGLSDVVITMSQAALYIVAMMDGALTCAEIAQRFEKESGQKLAADTMQSIIDGLDQAKFLQGASFEEFYNGKLAAYRAKPVREMEPTSALRMLDESGSLFVDILAQVESSPPTDRRVRGLVAPHLDYSRGRPCYGEAYARLKDGPPPSRVVVLGTNHFGRSTSVVATSQAFQTPLGTTETDVEFLQALEARCGKLRRFELDHQAEHSIELQVAWLQHCLGADAFQLVPFLCPDPCGPTGTAPYDGNGVDLLDFATALGDQVRESAGETLIIAGADLSHVGANFGDDRHLDTEFLAEVRDRDMQALHALETEGAGAWVESVARDENPTRVCSGGCIFALATALSGASASVMRYHQAVDAASQTCVTCAAIVLD